jgi:ribosome maturation factor RimP
MNKLEKNIKVIASKSLLSDQYILNVNGDADSGYVRITLDSERNISLKDTVKLTKRLKKSGEFIDLFSNGFRLEVSSPGIDSPLIFPFQYKKNIGKKISIVLNKDFDSINSDAVIKNADNEHVFLKVEERSLQVNYDSIILAKLKISFN